MIVGAISFGKELRVDLGEWLGSSWSEDFRPPATGVSTESMRVLASAPQSPLWRVEVLDGGNARGISVARLVSPTSGQLAIRRRTAAVKAVYGDVDENRFSSVWGSFRESTPQLVNGAFAAVYQDGDSLVMMRDTFGQVPLYWQRVGESVVFSSVFRDFTSLDGVTAEVDEEAARRLGGSGVGGKGEATKLRGVHRVWPGSVTRISRTGHYRMPEWDPFLVPTRTTLPFDLLAEQLESALIDSVEEAISPLEATASHLSGGMDSTLVSWVAQRSLKARGGYGLQKVYSWTPAIDGVVPPPDGESKAVRGLARTMGVPTWFGPPDSAPEFLARDPIIDPGDALYREHLVLRDAAESGVQVMLSGWGGDEFASFGGRHYAENLFRRRQPVRATRQVWLEQRAYGRRGIDLAARAGLLALRRWHRSMGRGSVAPPRDTGADMERFRAALSHWNARTSREMMRCMWDWGHLSLRIEHWWEAGRRQGVEYRFPMLDLRVVEQAVRMPERVWARDGEKRAPIRWVASRQIGSEWASSHRKSDPELKEWMRRQTTEGNS